jgi:5-methyltetrahydropteroyltriglutamate--homocysteine methyltransferase
MTQLAKDEFYGDEAALARAYADAVNQEARDLKAAGADYIQLDEPYLQAQPQKARAYGIEAIDRALAGVAGPTIVHMCFGYAYVVKDKPSGYSFLPELDKCRAAQISIEAAQPRLDLGDPAIETPDIVAGRIRAALDHVDAERLVIAPDCGMKYLTRDVAFAKLNAMVEGAKQVRATL